MQKLFSIKDKFLKKTKVQSIYMVGGLGSQMLAYSLYISLKRYYPEITLNTTWYELERSKDSCPFGYELEKVFGIKNKKPQQSYITNLILSSINSKNLFKKSLFYLLKKIKFVKWIEPQFSILEKYSACIYNLKGSFIMHQIWTNWAFLKGVEQDIRLQFVFPPFQDDLQLYYAQELSTVESVAVHVRRGDYIGTHLDTCGLAYYQKSMLLMRNLVCNPTFYVFSNDNNWCRNNLNFSNVRLIELDSITGVYSFRSMQLMSLCKHHIISNSSFSAWAAFLSGEGRKVVIAPRRWSNLDSRPDLSGMIRDDWVVVDN